MGRRALIGTIATLGIMALYGMFAVLLTLSPSPSAAYAQQNPITVSGQAAVRYAENDTRAVGTYSATNPATNPGQGAISWSLSGADSDDFTISPDSTDSTGGVLKFRAPPNYEAPADADSNNVYLVTVEALDGNTSHDRDVTVTVFDVNEPPTFPKETAKLTVDENTAAGQDLGPEVSADDPEDDTLIYRLEGPDGDSFGIDKLSGQLETRAPLDYETNSKYLVTLHVRDSKDQDARVNSVTDDTINITVNINNVEEPGRIDLSSAAAPGRNPLYRDPDRPRRRHQRYYVVVGEFHKAFLRLDRHRRRNVGLLHSGRLRRGQVPAGHGVLYRRAWSREKRDSGLGQSGAAKAEDKQSADFPRGDGQPQRGRKHGGEPTHRRSGGRHGHPQRHLPVDLLPGRDRRRFLRYQQVHRPVDDQSAVGPRVQEQLYGDGKGDRPIRHKRCH